MVHSRLGLYHVPVPLRVDVVDVAQDALIHHLLHGLVEIAGAALQAGLQNLIRMRGGVRAQRVHLVRLEHQALLAEDVLARVERVVRERIVHEQRREDEHRFDILLVQELVIVLVSPGVIADGFQPFFEVIVLDIADGHALACIDMPQMLHQILAAASRPDHAVLHAVVRGPDFLNGWRADRGGGRRDCPGGLHEIPAGKIVIRRHTGATSRSEILPHCNMRKNRKSASVRAQTNTIHRRGAKTRRNAKKIAFGVCPLSPARGSGSFSLSLSSQRLCVSASAV